MEVSLIKLHFLKIVIFPSQLLMFTYDDTSLMGMSRQIKQTRIIICF